MQQTAIVEMSAIEQAILELYKRNLESRIGVVESVCEDCGMPDCVCQIVSVYLSGDIIAEIQE